MWHTLIVWELNIYQKKLENSLEKNITNVYRIETYNSIMCGYFYIRFIDFMLKGESLLECTNLFSPNEY